MDLLPMHDIGKSFISCLENIGSLRCADLLNVGAFYYMTSKNYIY